MASLPIRVSRSIDVHRQHPGGSLLARAAARREGISVFCQDVWKYVPSRRPRHTFDFANPLLCQSVVVLRPGGCIGGGTAAGVFFPRRSAVRPHHHRVTQRLWEPAQPPLPHTEIQVAVYAACADRPMAGPGAGWPH